MVVNRILSILLTSSVAGACTEKLICPAYQSSYLYDKETLRKKFSYFNEDSTPRVFATAGGKNKYLLGEDVSYKRRVASLQTVPMIDVYPVLSDSAAMDSTEVLSSEKDIADSIVVAPKRPSDKGYMISKAKEKFNYDEELYLWYFRDVLILPDIKLAISRMGDKGKSSKAKQRSGKKTRNKEEGKKGVFGFLSKNRQTPADSTSVKPSKPVRRERKKSKKSDGNANPETPKKEGDDGF